MNQRSYNGTWVPPGEDMHWRSGGIDSFGVVWDALWFMGWYNENSVDLGCKDRVLSPCPGDHSANRLLPDLQRY
jgi:hypothetical protein